MMTMNDDNDNDNDNDNHHHYILFSWIGSSSSSTHSISSRPTSRPTTPSTMLTTPTLSHLSIYSFSLPPSFHPFSLINVLSEITQLCDYLVHVEQNQLVVIAAFFSMKGREDILTGVCNGMNITPNMIELTSVMHSKDFYQIASIIQYVLLI